MGGRVYKKEKTCEEVHTSMKSIHLFKYFNLIGLLNFSGRKELKLCKRTRQKHTICKTKFFIWVLLQRKNHTELKVKYISLKVTTTYNCSNVLLLQDLVKLQTLFFFLSVI